MKKHRLWGLSVAMLLLSSCHDGFREHVYRGLLFTDSTLATAFAGQTLTFYNNSSCVGQATTDDDGRWAFLWVENFIDPQLQMPAAKWSVEPEILTICHGGDTLYHGSTIVRDTMELYPGCWDGSYQK